MNEHTPKTNVSNNLNDVPHQVAQSAPSGVTAGASTSIPTPKDGRRVAVRKLDGQILLRYVPTQPKSTTPRSH